METLQTLVDLNLTFVKKIKEFNLLFVIGFV